MKFLRSSFAAEREIVQFRLMVLAGIFLFLLCLVLSLSPAVRFRTWQITYYWQHWIGFIIWVGVFSLLSIQIRKRLPGVDPFLLPITFLLSGWGLIVIWRLNTYFGVRQSIWLVLAAAIFYAGLRYPGFISLLRRYKYIWLVCGLLLTALTLLIGTYPGGEGPNLWLNLGGIYLQPSEPLKLLLVVYLSAYFADRIPLHINLIKLIAPTGIVVAAAIFLLLAQRDLGTAFLFILLYFIIIFLSSGNLWILVAGGILTSGAGLLGFQLLDVIKDRIGTWINPWLDPVGKSYQIVQSLLGFATGGILGRGLGLSNPGVVPISHSDFIFSAIAEEFGLVGSLAVVLLFALLMVRALVTAIQAPNNYRRYLAAGLAAYFSIQGLFITAGNLNLFPMSGITLPFMSYGGSSLIVSFAAVLILMIISAQRIDETGIEQNSKPYLFLGRVFLFGWSLIALSSGWWSIIRSDELVKRNDNPRLAINDLYMPRGNILDRHNQPITRTEGNPGDLKHDLLYPALSPVIGYSNLFYGQTALEQNLDSYLRGIQGNPSSVIWSNNVLFGQRPPGLDVRLSLDLALQNQADHLLAEKSGAVVLMNAQSGEILVMSSHPFYNANQLAEHWEEWMKDDNAPFLNRATQGQYRIGTALSPFLLAKVLEYRFLPTIPAYLPVYIHDNLGECTIIPEDAQSWGILITSGCEQAINEINTQLNHEDIVSLISQIGFNQAPEISIPTAAPMDMISQKFDMQDLSRASFYVSPLQVALAASSISASGIRPAASLVLAVHTPHQGWIILPQQARQNSFRSQTSQKVMELLTVPATFIWQSLGTAADETGVVTWYIGGTNSSWQGSPLAVVVLLEEKNAPLAMEIGQSLLMATIHPADSD